MMRILLWIVLACLGSAVRAQDVASLQAGVVKVIATTEGKRKTGAGFIVRLHKDRTFIATASHVVEGAEQIEVEYFTERNRFMPARVIGIEGADPAGIAALMVQSAAPTGTRALRWATDSVVKTGDPVLTIGFPRAAAPYSLVRGEIAGRHGKLLDIAAALDEGNSGGPLLSGDRVVGMVLEVRTPFAKALPALIARYVLESWAIDVGAVVSLRSAAASVTPRQIAQVLRENGFSHPGARVDGIPPGIAGNYQPVYETRVSGEDRIVIDHAAGLIWEQSGSRSAAPAEYAQAHVNRLNELGFAGASDWRLPTIEELLSLVRPADNTEGIYASVLFDAEKYKLWSSDAHILDKGTHRWGVDLANGTVSDDSSGIAAEMHRWAKAVRTKP